MLLARMPYCGTNACQIDRSPDDIEVSARLLI